MPQDTHILETRLIALAKTRYPLHMPGHKRRVEPAPGLPAAWDFTEGPGSDDLHEAEGILADAMARTAALWGAARTFYLINGATCGLLAGIRALAPAGSTVIAARNCHKSVFHALELGGLHARWVMPRPDEAFGIHGSVAPDGLAAALNAYPEARCVILTSPTYEGVLSDIAALAALCHARGVPLLVDEAHGAHYLPLAEDYGWRGGALAACSTWAGCTARPWQIKLPGSWRSLRPAPPPIPSWRPWTAAPACWPPTGRSGSPPGRSALPALTTP